MSAYCKKCGCYIPIGAKACYACGELHGEDFITRKIINNISVVPIGGRDVSGRLVRYKVETNTEKILFVKGGFK